MCSCNLCNYLTFEQQRRALWWLLGVSVCKVDDLAQECFISFYRSVSRCTEKHQKRQVGWFQQIHSTGRVVSRITAHNLNIFAKKACFRPILSQDIQNPTCRISKIVRL